MAEFTIKGEGQFEAAPEFWEWATAASEAETARIQEIARLSGMEVVYTFAFDRWLPVFKFGRAEPVAWIHEITGERRDGPACPSDQP